MGLRYFCMGIRHYIYGNKILTRTGIPSRGIRYVFMGIRNPFMGIR